MKVVGYDMGRLLVLFPTEEIVPRRGVHLPAALEAMKGKFLFVGAPDLSKSVEQLDREGYKFQQGAIEIGGELVAITEFGVFSDGISITCRDTAHAEAVWEEFLSWGKDAVGLREFIREPKRYFRSQIAVEFEPNLASLIADFSRISEIVSDAMKHTPHKDEAIDFARFAVGTDSTKIAGLSPVPFTIERLVGSPFEHNRFFSEASLPTDRHIEALERIEASLSST